MNQIKIFDYPAFANNLRLELRDHAELVAKENNLEIEFIRKVGAFRKEARIKEILASRGMHPGLVYIFSAMEACTSYKPWHDKTTGKTFLTYDSGKCLHYYFYFIDKVFGLYYLRVPTWAPFRLQFYYNGHNYLAGKLDKAAVGYSIRENAFTSRDDYQRAQAFSYNKFGQVLRIETTTNDVSQFKCFRDVQHHDGSIDRKNAPMKKGIYSMHLLSGLLKASNRRYVEFVSTFDDVSSGIDNLKKVAKTVVSDKQTYKGFNFFAEDDVKLLVTLERGEFNISGFQNKTLHRF